MRISNFIASHHVGEGPSKGAFTVGIFVVAVLLGSAGAAAWIGSSMSHPANAPSSIEVADEAYQ